MSICTGLICLNQQLLSNFLLRFDSSIQLDSVDSKILEILSRDSSISFVEMGRMLRITDGTVRNRIRQLRKAGVIRKFTISVDGRVVGNNIVAFVAINTVPGRASEVAKRLSSLDEVAEVYEIHTYGDLLVKVRAKNPETLANILSTRIKTVGGVIGTQVIMPLNVWKDST